MRRLFFSDVHLTPSDPGRTRRLAAFLAREAPRADELFILGDLFDYWIGPKHLHLPDYAEALAALRKAAAGTRIVFLCGNRDFYMRGFERATGVEVAPGRTRHRLEVQGRRVCLCHGDYLEGRRDAGFLVQRFIRSRAVEAVWTRLPASLARLGARFYRWLSERNKRTGRADRRHLAPYGLCPDQVAEEFARGTEVLVCGHVHRAQEVREPVPGQGGVLYTLGDWCDDESYLEVEDGRWRLRGGKRTT
jgi:UDP-2,3-diacylglucosamine hydrolase